MSGFRCPGRSKTARRAELIPSLFSERFSENDSERTRVEPWLDTCTAAYTRLAHTHMRHAHFTQSAILKRSRAQRLCVRGVGRTDAQSANLVRSLVLVLQSTGGNEASADRRSMRTFLRSLFDLAFL